MTLDGSPDFVVPGILRLRGAIKRSAAAERKLERALCPIHTMVRSKAIGQAYRRLTDFSRMARADPYGNRRVAAAD